jgi:hypothetical protein
MVFAGKVASLRGGGEGLLFWRIIMTDRTPPRMAPPPLAPPPSVFPTRCEFEELVNAMRELIKDVDDLKIRVELLEPIPPVKKVEGTFLEKAIASAIKNPPTKSLFTGNCFIKSVIGNQVLIGCATEPLANMLRQPTKLTAITEAIKQVISAEATVTLVVEKRASN